MGAIRLLTPADVPGVLELTAAAGWNQTAGDIEMLLSLAPDGCFGIEAEGRLAATTTLLPLSPQLAWLGMVLTGAPYQRRGFARRLCEHAIAKADNDGIGTVKLDATAMGRPLYLSLGFRDEQPIERWSGHLQQLRPGADEKPAATPLLAALAARSEVFRFPGGCALVRPGSRARYMGPFTANNLEAAGALMLSAFRAGEGDVFYWDVLPWNNDAVQLLRELGFERVRSLVRMVRGPDLPTSDSRTYAIAGFELG